ncbi:hypothetical protein [Planktotalea sp.]|uniref:hypothetical protein n=1 Tax=Planktotalea sp. TaxID=2029877 RepID=UPI003D6A6357
MSKRRPGNLPVTDHAVLRWIERFGFVDVEAVRAQIFRETHEALKSGASKLKVNGTEYRIKDGVVVTLIDKRETCRPLKWSRRK